MRVASVSKYLLSFLLILLPVLMAAQNPFDLKHRLVKPQDTTEITIERPAEETSELDAEPTLQESFPEEFPEPEEQVVAEVEKEEVPEETAVIREEKSEHTDSKTELEKEADSATIGGAKAEEKDSNQMMLFIFLLSTVFLALIIAADRTVLNKLYRSLINDNFLSFFMREQKSGTSLQLFFLHTFFIINLGLLAYFVLQDILLLNSGIKLWHCIAFVSGIYLSRHLFMNYLKLFVKAEKEINRFYFTIIIFNIFFGLLIFPLNVFSAFAPEMISTTASYISVFIFIFIFLARQLRGLFIGSKYFIDHQFHFFVYLCTVEIAPILILGKFFTTII